MSHVPESAHFTGIKWNDKAVEIGWFQRTENGKITSGVEDKTPPTAEFRDSLQAFAPLVAKLCGFSPKWGAELVVIGVSVDYDKHDRMGMVVSAKRTLGKSRSPLVINTPHRREAAEDDDAKEFALGSDWLEAFEALKAQAIRYVDGERMQLSLMDEDAA